MPEFPAPLVGEGPDMHRRSFFRLLTIVAGGARIKAQEPIHGVASNGSGGCCGLDNIESGEKKAGKVYEAAVGVFEAE